MSSPSSAALPNSRRGPRLPLRCAVVVEADGRDWAAETEDLGLQGCQLLAPESLAPGLSVRLRLSHPDMSAPLRVSGQVAWAGPCAPWRHGVAFAVSDLEGAGRWLARIVSLHPELVVPSRIPAWLEPDDRLHLGEAPAQGIDFSAAEVMVLREARAGLTVAELRQRLEASWDTGFRALFSLLARRALTLDAAQAGQPAAWQKVLEQLERAPVRRAGRAERAGPAGPTPTPQAERAGQVRQVAQADGARAVARIATVRALVVTPG